MPSGFLYDVKAIVDKASFAEGIRELQKLEQTSKRLITGIAGISASVIGSATVAGEVATQELRVARSIGVSTEALSSWKVAANVAGASASGLIGTLSSLENKMQHLKTGTVDSALAKNLGMLGVSYGDFADMDAESRMRTVFNQADQMEDQQLAATLVGDILGQAGKDYYDSLKLSGKSIDEQLQEARKLNFVSTQNRKEAAIFASEVRAVKEAGKSITMLFGTEIASALTPTVKTVKKYLIDNREAIRKGITGFAQQTAGLFNTIADGLIKVVPIVTGLIDNFGGLDKIIVKVGVGFASFKLMQLAGGLRAIISGVSLLKAAIGGLVGTGLYFLIDDIIGYSQGKISVFGYLKQQLEELGISDRFAKSFEQIREILGSEKMQNAMKAFENFIKLLVGNTINLIVDTLDSLSKVLDALINKDWQKLAEGIGSLGDSFGNFIGATVTGTSTGEFVSKQDAYKKATSILWQEGGGKKQKWSDYSAVAQQAVRDAIAAGNKESQFKGFISGKIDDGIISPSGKITKVSPDDWVFAVKDIADLAGGLMPAGVNTTNNNNMNAPANYVINQNFSIGAGVRASEVRAQAYRGTSEALQNNLSNASRIMQMMPGTR